MTDIRSIDHWNYRVRVYMNAEHEEVWQIIEAYYDADGDILGWVETGHCGENEADLRSEFEAMLEALKRPVLEEGDLPRGMVA